MIDHSLPVACASCGNAAYVREVIVNRDELFFPEIDAVVQCNMCLVETTYRVPDVELIRRMQKDFESRSTLSEEEPKPELRALSGSVIGYRAWGLNNWKLTGTGMGSAHQWVPGDNEAKCLSGLHSAPSPSCHCGFNALARFSDSESWWDAGNGPMEVVGAIEAWADADENNEDRFFLHANGFRAQRAKVILLATSDEYPKAKNAAIRALASEYGADVCRKEHLEDAAKEHGQLVPDEWLEWAKEDEPPGLHRGNSFLSPASIRSIQHFAQTFSGGAVYATGGGHGGYFVSPAVTPVAGYSGTMIPASAWPAHYPTTSRSRASKGPKLRVRKGGSIGPPTLGTWKKRDVMVDGAGDWWECRSPGSPGTWEQVDPRA